MMENTSPAQPQEGYSAELECNLQESRGSVLFPRMFTAEASVDGSHHEFQNRSIGTYLNIRGASRMDTYQVLAY